MTETSSLTTEAGAAKFACVFLVPRESLSGPDLFKFLS